MLMHKTQCLPASKLKEYLHGWVSSDVQSEIESHLLECPACENTIVQLEQEDSDTLLEVFHAPVSPEHQDRESEIADAPIGSLDPVIAYAIARTSTQVAPPSEEVSRPSPLPDKSIPASVGPYSLLRPLGHGGMGTVYLAQHQPLGKEVAIKLLPERAFRKASTELRFQREIRTAGQLSHPAIVNATDAGTCDGMHYLVMEFIDGYDLSRIARSVGPLSYPDVCAVGYTVALGLAHAHASGVVHRDIKPSNIILSRTGQVKVLDFGLAQSDLWEEASAELTTVGQLMGTIDYMAPEQAEHANNVDYRADLYSLGATLYRLLAGRAPHAAAPNLSPLAKLRMLATSDPPSLRMICPDLPPLLLSLVDQLLDRDPSHRPASAMHVAQSLQPFCVQSQLVSLIHCVDSDPNTNIEPTAFSHSLTSNIKHEKPKVAPNRFSGGRHTGKWVALAMIPASILAGIFISLEMGKGQLVIESEEATVEVKLLKDGKQYDTLEVVPGAQVTRLLAGKYEIVIGGASDQFSIDRDTIDLKRGETLIARIRQKKDSFQQQSGEFQKQLNFPTSSNPGPIYKGQTMGQWFQVFARDRSPEAIRDSLEAITALISPNNANDAGDRLLAALKDIDGKILLPPNQENLASMELDDKAVEVLLKCFSNTETRTKRLCQAIEQSDDAFATRLLNMGRVVKMFDPTIFLAWGESKVFGTDRREALELPTAMVIRNMVFLSEREESWKNQAVHMLSECRSIPKSFYLEVLPGPSAQQPWDRGWFEHAAQVALNTLLSNDSDETDRMRSCILLRILQLDPRHAAKQTGKGRLEERIVQELQRLLHKDDERLKFIQLPGYLSGETHPGLPDLERTASTSKLESLGIHFNLMINGGQTGHGNLVIEYLKLLQSFDAPVEDNTRKILEAYVADGLASVIEVQLSRGTNSFGEFQIFPNPQSRMVMIPWPLEIQNQVSSLVKNEKDRQNWLKYFQFKLAFLALAKRVNSDNELPDIITQTQEAFLDRMIADFDSNQDGSLSKEEGTEAVKLRISKMFDVAPRPGTKFFGGADEFDTNQDGVLQKSELSAGLINLASRLKTDRTSNRGGGGGRPPSTFPQQP